MRIALPLAALLAITAPAAAQDIAPVDGKPGTDIVSAGTIGDVHVVAETTLAKGRLVLHVVAVNRGIKPSLAELSPDERWDHKRYQGVMLTGVDFRLVDAEDHDLPFDGVAQGELLLRGPWITSSYHDLNEPERFHEGYWRSGDVATIDQHGYVKVVDRIKDVIKSGGEWISSIDMENALTAHPRVREAAVIGAAHPKWQERPVALIVSTDGEPIPVEELYAVLEQHFAKWQMPEKVLFLDGLQRTSVGKLDKKAMRAEHGDVYTDA